MSGTSEASGELEPRPACIHEQVGNYNFDCHYCFHRLKTELASERERNNDLQKENEEQARLLGKSGSVEAALLAKLSDAERQLSNVLTPIPGEIDTIGCLKNLVAEKDARILDLQSRNASLEEALKKIANSPYVTDCGGCIWFNSFAKEALQTKVGEAAQAGESSTGREDTGEK